MTGQRPRPRPCLNATLSSASTDPRAFGHRGMESASLVQRTQELIALKQLSGRRFAQSRHLPPCCKIKQFLVSRVILRRDFTNDYISSITANAFSAYPNLVALFVFQYFYQLLMACRFLTTNLITSVALGAFNGLSNLVILLIFALASTTS